MAASDAAERRGRWTLIDQEGNIQGSDSDIGSASSSDCVALKEDTVLYRSKRSSSRSSTGSVPSSPRKEKGEGSPDCKENVPSSASWLGSFWTKSKSVPANAGARLEESEVDEPLPVVSQQDRDNLDTDSLESIEVLPMPCDSHDDGSDKECEEKPKNSHLPIDPLNSGHGSGWANSGAGVVESLCSVSALTPIENLSPTSSRVEDLTSSSNSSQLDFLVVDQQGLQSGNGAAANSPSNIRGAAAAVTSTIDEEDQTECTVGTAGPLPIMPHGTLPLSSVSVDNIPRGVEAGGSPRRAQSEGCISQQSEGSGVGVPIMTQRWPTEDGGFLLVQQFRGDGEPAMSRSSSFSDLSSSMSYPGERRRIPSASTSSLRHQSSSDASSSDVSSSSHYNNSDDTLNDEALPANMTMSGISPGVRQYLHRRDESLNSKLTLAALLVITAAMSLVLGHYIGSTQATTHHLGIESGQVWRLRSLQDQLVTCLDKTKNLLRAGKGSGGSPQPKAPNLTNSKQDVIPPAPLPDPPAPKFQPADVDIGRHCSMCNIQNQRYSEFCNTECPQFIGASDTEGVPDGKERVKSEMVAKDELMLEANVEGTPHSVRDSPNNIEDTPQGVDNDNNNVEGTPHNGDAGRYVTGVFMHGASSTLTQASEAVKVEDREALHTASDESSGTQNGIWGFDESRKIWVTDEGAIVEDLESASVQEDILEAENPDVSDAYIVGQNDEGQLADGGDVSSDEGQLADGGDVSSDEGQLADGGDVSSNEDENDFEQQEMNNNDALYQAEEEKLTAAHPEEAEEDSPKSDGSFMEKLSLKISHSWFKVRNFTTELVGSAANLSVNNVTTQLKENVQTLRHQIKDAVSNLKKANITSQVRENVQNVGGQLKDVVSNIKRGNVSNTIRDTMQDLGGKIKEAVSDIKKLNVSSQIKEGLHNLRDSLQGVVSSGKKGQTQKEKPQRQKREKNGNEESGGNVKGKKHKATYSESQDSAAKTDAKQKKERKNTKESKSQEKIRKIKEIRKENRQRRQEKKKEKDLIKQNKKRNEKIVSQDNQKSNNNRNGKGGKKDEHMKNQPKQDDKDESKYESRNKEKDKKHHNNNGKKMREDKDTNVESKSHKRQNKETVADEIKHSDKEPTQEKKGGRKHESEKGRSNKASKSSKQEQQNHRNMGDKDGVNYDGDAQKEKGHQQHHEDRHQHQHQHHRKPYQKQEKHIYSDNNKEHENDEQKETNDERKKFENINWETLFESLDVRCLGVHDCLRKQREAAVRLYEELLEYQEWLMERCYKKHLDELQDFMEELEEFLAEPFVTDADLEELMEDFEDMAEDLEEATTKNFRTFMKGLGHGRKGSKQSDKSKHHSTHHHLEHTKKKEDKEETLTVTLDFKQMFNFSESLKDDNPTAATKETKDKRKHAGYGYQSNDDWFIRRMHERENQRKEKKHHGRFDKHDDDVNGRWYEHWMKGREEGRSGMTVWDLYQWFSKRQALRHEWRLNEMDDQSNWFLRRP